MRGGLAVEGVARPMHFLHVRRVEDAQTETCQHQSVAESSLFYGVGCGGGTGAGFVGWCGDGPL